jgi:hypothetical protein
MTVKDFINGYNKPVSDNLKKTYLKDNLQTKTYIAFTEKLSKAKRIAKITTHEYNKDGKETGNIRVDSVARYLLFTLNIIDMYTNIDINFSNTAAEYDLLAENGLVKEILSMIPENEVSDFKILLDMSVDDIMANELSTQAFISNQITRFGQLANVTINPILEKLADEIGNLDEDKINQLSDIVKTTNNQKIP